MILIWIFALCSYHSKIQANALSLSTTPLEAPNTLAPPIVYTIAGSDSGGGAGIQADLHAMHSMGVHGCSAITCLTAQSSVGVTGVHSPPTDFLRLQLDTLVKDMPPRAIKIGMLGSKELAIEVGNFLKDLLAEYSTNQYAMEKGGEGDERGDRRQDVPERPFVVLDPVMISTSGHRLIQEDAKAAMIEFIFPHVDIVTPNKFEAEELLGRSLNSFQDVERAAKDILDMGVKSVLIKGGHAFSERNMNDATQSVTDVYAQDYFLSKERPLDKDGRERICDGCRGVWLRTDRYDSIHTHGTGCTLSSVIASSLAIGHQQRSLAGGVGGEIGTGAARSIYMVDACILAKAYITAGVASGVAIGQGPGPVVHTKFPGEKKYFPVVALDPTKRQDILESFLKMKRSTRDDNNHGGDDRVKVEDQLTLGKLLPIVDSVEWMERLTKCDEITDIQLRIKGETDEQKILELVQKCQDICQRDGVRLWVNDFWRAAVKVKCFGVHMGQEDLARCVDEGGLEQIRSNGLALGVSTHSYAELAAALGIQPSYISLGPIFGTKSKNVAFDPQGLLTVRKWRDLIGSEIPLVAIGGINDVERTKQVKLAGADCVAIIGAVQKDDVPKAVKELNDAMS